MFPERLSSDRSFNPSLPLGDVILVCSVFSWASGVTVGLAQLPTVQPPLRAPVHQRQRCLPPPSALLAHPAAARLETALPAPGQPHASSSHPILNPPNLTPCFTFQRQTPQPLVVPPHPGLAVSPPPPPRSRAGGSLPRAHTACAASRACLGAGIESETPACTASVFEKGHLAGLAVQAEFAGWF